MKREVNILISIQEKVETEGFEALTKQERYYWTVFCFGSDCYDADLGFVFRSSSPEFIHDAFAGLKEIGAYRKAEVLEMALNLFLHHQGILDKEGFKYIFDELPLRLRQLDDLSEKFDEAPDDLPALLNDYVVRNSSQFAAPTALEVWQSRRARGAETRPHGISDLDLEYEANQDSKWSQRKCPVCLQPAPDYRKTCKRCGYPYGQVARESREQ